MLSHSGTRAPGRIARLPEHLINQIAAGEVVERPASVVKELVENSLDAGSRRIDILLREGGLEEIQILDDGHGIEKDQLALALERHTTSKLTNFEDLDGLITYGFRGEALSSISSVAEVTLKSRTANEPSGYALTITHGVSEPIRPVAQPVGTSLTVRRLFERVPARQKFMRTPSTEFSHCARVVKETAIGNPAVAFYLHHQGKMAHAYPPGTRRSRFQEGAKGGWEPLVLSEENDGASLEAFLSPAHWLADRGELLVYVNGRSVRAKALSGLLRNIYSNVLGPHHEPCGVVYLDLRHDWVDVNVHPQKLEVRILKQEGIFQWLGASVRKALQTQKAKNESENPRPLETPPFHPPVPPFSTTARSPDIQSGYPTLSVQDLFSESDPEPSAKQPFGPAPQARPLETRSNGLRYLGQLQARYLLCDDERGVVIVDQNALHTRLTFEELKARSEHQSPKSQLLLVPKLLKVPKEHTDLLEAIEPLMQKLGFQWDLFGDNEIAIKAIPAAFPEGAVETAFLESLTAFAETADSARTAVDAALAPLLKVLARNSAVASTRALGPVEATGLLAKLERIDESWTCPNGRPVFFRLSYQTLAKHFGRT